MKGGGRRKREKGGGRREDGGGRREEGYLYFFKLVLKVPLVEVSIVPITFSKVVLPPPEGPRIITNSPLNAAV